MASTWFSTKSPVWSMTLNVGDEELETYTSVP